jgi:uncharacterized flavoprotein (TIGR03862 family)
MTPHSSLSAPLTRASAAVIGAGPAGLMAAERLAWHGVAVTVFDRMPSPARKLLMAGVGGLNLTHSEPLETLLDQYGPAREHLAPAIRAFPPEALRAWCAELGQETFVGSSGRVFPVAMKASPLLRVWLRRLDGMGVVFRMRHRWLGWHSAGRPMFDPAVDMAPDAVILALGGASWPRLGSDGAWASSFDPAALAPFRPSNCGFITGWSEPMRRHAGAPLKRIAVTFGGRRVPGEAVVTANGIEGGPFYALAAALRDAIEIEGAAIAHLDLRPDLSLGVLRERLAAPRRAMSLSNFLRKTASLPPVAITLLRECAPGATDLAAAIKALPLRLTGTTGLSRAISTSGGLRFDALLPPCVFPAGEMLDWEAPTGGYLLQAAFSTGYAAGEAAAQYMSSSSGVLPRGTSPTSPASLFHNPP